MVCNSGGDHFRASVVANILDGVVGLIVVVEYSISFVYFYAWCFVRD